MFQTAREHEPPLDSLFQKRLDQEIARVQEQAKKAVEEFRASFAPPNEAQMEKLLYPELNKIRVELGGRTFELCELPALKEKEFIAIVEGRIPALVAEILGFDERLDNNATQAFTKLLSHARAVLDVVTEACVLVLDPNHKLDITMRFVQEHASTARQLRILKAQLLLNGGRDFLLRLFPDWMESPSANSVIPILQPPSVGSSSSEHPRARLD